MTAVNRSWRERMAGKQVGASAPPAPATDGLTKAELVELAAELGIEVPSRATKAELVELIEGG